MDENEKRLVRHLYDLQLELYNTQGEEIAALRRANEALQRSHEVIGKLLKTTADLMGLH